jgi:hypothetical protein
MATELTDDLLQKLSAPEGFAAALAGPRAVPPVAQPVAQVSAPVQTPVAEGPTQQSLEQAEANIQNILNAPAPPKEMGTMEKVLSGLGSATNVGMEALGRTAAGAGSSLINAAQQNLGGTYEPTGTAGRDLADVATDWLSKYAQDYSTLDEESARFGVSRDNEIYKMIRDTPPSLGTSLLSTGAGLGTQAAITGAGILGAAPTGGASAVAARLAAPIAGTAASTATMYLTTKADTLRDLISAVNDATKETQGRYLTEDEIRQYTAQFSEAADKVAKTEIGTEAFGTAIQNVFLPQILGMAKLNPGLAAAALKRVPVLKKYAASKGAALVGGLGASIPVELGGETVAERLQSQQLAEATKGTLIEKSFADPYAGLESPNIEALKQVAPGTVGQALATFGAAGVGGMVNTRMKRWKDEAEAAKRTPPTTPAAPTPTNVTTTESEAVLEAPAAEPTPEEVIAQAERGAVADSENFGGGAPPAAPATPHPWKDTVKTAFSEILQRRREGARARAEIEGKEFDPTPFDSDMLDNDNGKLSLRGFNSMIGEEADLLLEADPKLKTKVSQTQARDVIARATAIDKDLGAAVLGVFTDAKGNKTGSAAQLAAVNEFLKLHEGGQSEQAGVGQGQNQEAPLGGQGPEAGGGDRTADVAGAGQEVAPAALPAPQERLALPAPTTGPIIQLRQENIDSSGMTTEELAAAQADLSQIVSTQERPIQMVTETWFKRYLPLPYDQLAAQLKQVQRMPFGKERTAKEEAIKTIMVHKKPAAPSASGPAVVPPATSAPQGATSTPAPETKQAKAAKPKAPTKQAKAKAKAAQQVSPAQETTPPPKPEGVTEAVAPETAAQTSPIDPENETLSKDATRDYRKESGEKTANVRITKVDPPAGGLLKSMQTVIERLGVKVQFIQVEGTDRINGFVNPKFPRTVFINVAAQKPYQFVLGHEIGHLADNMGNAESKAFRDALNKVTGQKIGTELAMDTIGELATDPKFWDQVATVMAYDNRLGVGETTTEKVFKRVAEWVAEFNQAVLGATGDRAIVDQYFNTKEIGRLAARSLARLKDGDLREEYMGQKAGKKETQFSVSPAKEVWHAGDMRYGSDTTNGRMTAGRGTGHFGTGVYFVGGKEKLGSYRADRPAQSFSFEGLNMLRPRSEQEGFDLHAGLKLVNDARAATGEARESKISDAVRTLKYDLPGGWMTGEKTNELREKVAAAVEAAAADFKFASTEYSESASTRLLRSLGYDGVDVTNYPGLDGTTYGSVVFGESVSPRGTQFSIDDKTKKRNLEVAKNYDSILQELNRQKEASRGILPSTVQGGEDAAGVDTAGLGTDARTIEVQNSIFTDVGTATTAYGIGEYAVDLEDFRKDAPDELIQTIFEQERGFVDNSLTNEQRLDLLQIADKLRAIGAEIPPNPAINADGVAALPSDEWVRAFFPQFADVYRQAAPRLGLTEDRWGIEFNEEAFLPDAETIDETRGVVSDEIVELTEEERPEYDAVLEELTPIDDPTTQFSLSDDAVAVMRKTSQVGVKFYDNLAAMSKDPNGMLAAVKERVANIYFNMLPLNMLRLSTGYLFDRLGVKVPAGSMYGPANPLEQYERLMYAMAAERNNLSSEMATIVKPLMDDPDMEKVFSEPALEISYLRMNPLVGIDEYTDGSWVPEKVANLSSAERIAAAEAEWKKAQMDKATGLSYTEAYNKAKLEYQKMIGKNPKLKAVYKNVIDKLAQMRQLQREAFIQKQFDTYNRSINEDIDDLRIELLAKGATEAQIKTYIEGLQKEKPVKDKQWYEVSDEATSLSDSIATLTKARDSQVSKARAMFSKLRGNYLPLSRFGDMVIALRDKDGKTIEQHHFESAFERDLFRQEAEAKNAERKAKGEEEYIIDEFVKPDYSGTTRGVPKTFADDIGTELDASLDRRIAKAKKQLDKGEISKDEYDSTVKMYEAQKATNAGVLYQVWLDSTPESSALKNSIKRKNTRGYSTDIARVIADYTVRHSSHISHSKYDHLIAGVLSDSQKALREMNKQGKRTNYEMRILNSLRSRLAHHERTEGSGWISQKLTSLSTIWYMSSPSAYLMQISQLATVVGPAFAAKYGAVKSTAAINKAIRRAMKGDLATDKLTDEYLGDTTGKTIEQATADANVLEVAHRFHTRVTADDHANNRHKQLPVGAYLYTPDQIQAEIDRLKMPQEDIDRVVIKRAMMDNLIDISMSSELIREAGSRASTGLTGMSATFMKKGEEYSRKVAMLAAQSLEQSKGSNIAKAFTDASRGVHDTVFNYTRENKPIFMTQSDAARVALQFQFYRVNVLARMLMMAHKGFSKNFAKDPGPNATPEQKAQYESERAQREQAKREFWYMNGAAFGVAGAVGTPLAGAGFMLSDLIRGIFADDEDELFIDSEAEFKRAVGPLVAYGVPGMMGVDLTKRVGPRYVIPGMGEGAPENLQGSQWFAWHTLNTLGPSYQLGTNMVDAAKAVGEGDYLTASKEAMPKGIRDMGKAIETATRGIRDSKGRKLTDDNLNPVELMLMAFGFNPLDYYNVLDKQRSIKKLQAKASKFEARLIDDWAAAVYDGDDEAVAEISETIYAYADKHPEMAAGIGGQMSSALRTLYKNDLGVKSKSQILTEQALGYDEEGEGT